MTQRTPILTRRQLLATGALTLAAPVLGACSTSTLGELDTPVGQIVPSKLAIVHTGGIAGCFALDDDHLPLAAVARHAQDLAEDGYDVLLVDGGGSIAGTDLVDLSDGEAAVGFLNAAGYDVLALGGAELAFGQETLATRASQSDFALLSANLVDEAHEKPLAEASRTFKLSDGRMVGVFALTPEEVLQENTPLDWRGLSFDPAGLLEVAQQQVADLRSQDCRLVICVASLGSYEGALTAADIATKTSGINVVLDVGETHNAPQTLTDASGEDVLVVQTRPRLADANVVYWETGTLSTERLATFADLPRDEQVDALITQSQLELEELLAIELAQSSYQLDAKDSAQRETALGDLVADALLWEAGHGLQTAPDAALIDGASLAGALPKGTVTWAEIIGICPHVQSWLCVVEMEGAALLELLEGACKGLPKAAKDAPQMAGIEVALAAAANKKGQRLSITRVGSRAFAATDTYRVVTTQRLACGLGDWPAMANEDLSNAEPLQASAATALSGYLKRSLKGKVGKQYAKPQERISSPKRDTDKDDAAAAGEGPDKDGKS